jgi:hypothetical protein
LNEDEALEGIQSLLGSEYTVLMLSLEGPLLKQVKLLAQTAYFISLAGSGSHQMMWLPNGAVSITIAHPYHNDVKAGICSKSTRVLCLKSPSSYPNGTALPAGDLECRRAQFPVVANLSALEGQLKLAK